MSIRGVFTNDWQGCINAAAFDANTELEQQIRRTLCHFEGWIKAKDYPEEAKIELVDYWWNHLETLGEEEILTLAANLKANPPLHIASFPEEATQ